MSHHFDCFVILPDQSQSSVLMERADSHWSLPHFVFAEDHFGIVGHVGTAVRERWGIHAPVLRCVFYESETERDYTYCVYVMEAQNVAASSLPPCDQWIAREQVLALPLAHPEHRVLLEAWLAEREQGQEMPLRPAFAQSGFYAQCVHWATATLGNQGRRLTGSVEQLRLWQRCCLLRVPTDRGDVYLKAVAGPFAHEVGLTLALYRHFPERVPTVLAINATTGLLMTSDFAGQSLESVQSIAFWEQVVRQYAALQVEGAAMIDQWLALGCPDRRLAVLYLQIQQRLVGTGTSSLYHHGGLTPAEFASIEDMAAQWCASCDALASMGLPATLNHGDLCAGNVAITANGLLFFDWSDASVAHPFFDLFWLLHGVEERFPDVPDVRDHLRDAYLET